MKQSSPPQGGSVRTEGSGRESKGKEKAVVGSCWCWTHSLNPKGFPFLTAPGFLSSPRYPEPGKTSVSEGVEIPVYSFIKRGNRWKGRVGGEEYMMGPGELLVFPSMQRTWELNSLLGRYDCQYMFLSSIHTYICLCLYVCQCNI